MRAVLRWSPLVALVIALLVGRSLAVPDPAAKVYWNWLSWSGVAVGIVNGFWAGNPAKAARSWFNAVIVGATVACGLSMVQATAYGVMLPDALMLPPGQVPQDNFTAWFLGGVGLVPAAAVVGAVSGWWAWRARQNPPVTWR